MNATAAEQAFLSSLLNPITEDFETFGEGTTSVVLDVGLGIGIGGEIGDGIVLSSIGATLFGNATIDALATAEIPGDRYPISGSQYVTTERSEFGDFNRNDPVELAFNDPVAAFGFWATDVGDFGGQLILTIMFASIPDIVFDLGSTGNQGGSSIFFGLTSDEGITGVQFATSNTDDFIGYDNFTVGHTLVPEPASLVFFGTGLAGLAWRRRPRAVRSA